MNLPVSDGNTLYFEEHGNPEGVPAVVLHGGPGSGLSQAFTRFFDPDHFRVVLYDQRNCGQSTPHASDPSVSLEHNRILELLQDLEALRGHLGIEKWLMVGQSFGTTLGLAYAETWPERLRGLIVIGAALGSPAEIDWLYGGAGAFFPLEYARFVEILDESERDDPVPAYQRRLESEDAAVRADAALRWTEWDWATSSVTPTPLPPGRWSDPAFQLARARICTHYFTGDVQAAGNQLVRPHHLERLRSVPGMIINGRLDLQCPLAGAYALHRLWPQAEVVVVDNAGHSSGDAGMNTAIRAATDRFAS
ncbi:MAG: proline iminopeptidase [Actinomycetota bacterium]|jgi:proline iminopeptidase